MAILRNIQTGEDESFPDASVPALLQSGKYKVTDDTVVNVTNNATGAVTSVKGTDLSRLRNEHVTSGDEERQILEEEKYGGGIANTLEALAGGAISELSFGALKPWQKEQEYNTTARILGKGVGLVAPFLIPGGAEAKAAEAIPAVPMIGSEADFAANIGGKISSLGKDVELYSKPTAEFSAEMVTPRAVHEFSKANPELAKKIFGAEDLLKARYIDPTMLAREGLSTNAADYLPAKFIANQGSKIAEAIGGTAGTIAAGAAEGAGFYTARAALDDDVDFSAESLLEATVLGGGIAAGGLAISAGVRKVEDAYNSLKSKSAEVAEAVDNKKLLDAIERNRPVEKFRLNDESNLSSISKDFPLHSANQKLIRDASTLNKQIETWQASKFSSIDPEIQSSIASGQESLKLISKFAKQPADIQAQIMNNYEQHLFNIDEMVAKIASKPGGIDVSLFPKRWQLNNIISRQNSIESIATEGLGSAEIAAQKLAARMSVGTDIQSVKEAISDNLLSKLSSAAGYIPGIGKHIKSVTQIAEGASGFSKGLTGGLIIDKLIDSGLSSKLFASAAKVAPAIIAGKLIKHAFPNSVRAAAVSGITASQIAKISNDDSPLPKDRGSRALAAANRILALSPADAQRIATSKQSKIASISPQVATSIGMKAMNRQALLHSAINSIIPQSRSAIQLKKQKLSSKQIKQIENIVSIATDPVAFIRLLSSGKADAKSLHLAQQFWPSTIARAKIAAMNWLSKNHGKDISRHQSSILQLLLGKDAVGSQRNDSAIATQKVIAKAKERTKNLQQNGNSFAKANSQRSTSFQSPSSNITGRPTD